MNVEDRLSGEVSHLQWLVLEVRDCEYSTKRQGGWPTKHCTAEVTEHLTLPLEQSGRLVPQYRGMVKAIRNY